MVSDGGNDRLINGSVSSVTKRPSNGANVTGNGGKRTFKGSNGKNKSIK